MKILVVSPFFPYKNVPHAGGNYIFELVRGLSGNHSVHLVSRVEPEELKYVSEIESLCESVLLYPFKTPERRSFTGMLRIIYSYFKLGRIARRCIDAGDFDVVQVEYVETAVMLKKIKKCAAVLDAHDIVSKPAERRYRRAETPSVRLLYLFIWKSLKMAEVYAVSKFNLVITRSDIDRSYLSKMGSEIPVSVIPHPLKRVRIKGRAERAECGILFAGAMNRKLNQDAVTFIVEKVLPAVRARVPDVRFFVVGNNPPENIAEYAEKDENIVVTGFVDNIMDYYLDATVLVTPLFVGGGIIAKNVDAMGSGVPVVTSRIGNEGIRAVDGESVLIAETGEEFSKSILKVLTDPEFAAEISRAGREFALKRFDLRVIMRLAEESLERAVSEYR